jgi:hypothetical protein
MLKNIILAIVATATIGVASIDTAEARDRHHRRHHHNGANLIIGFGGFGGGFYGSQFDRDYYGYGNGYYGHRRYNRLYANDYFEPYCGTRRVKVKKWNRSHTRYTIVRRRVSDCY